MTDAEKANRIESSVNKSPAVGIIHTDKSDQFDTLHEEALKSIGNSPSFNRTGLKAQGMTEEFDRNSAANDEKIRNECYKNDPKGYQLYKRATADYEIQKRKAIAQYEMAQVAHGLQEANKDRRRDSLASAIETFKMGYGAAKLHQASMLEEENGKHAAALEAIENDKNLSASTVEQMPETTSKEEIENFKKQEQERLNKRTLDEVTRNQTAQAAIDVMFGNQTKELFKNFNDSMMKMFRSEYEFQKGMGHDEREAFDAASSATRADVVSALKAMIDGGNGEFVNSVVLPILNDPDAIKVFDYERDADGKEVLYENGQKKIVEKAGVFDMSGRLFLEEGDIRAIEKYLASHVAEVRATQKLKEEEYASQLKAIVYNSQVLIDSVYDEAAQKGQVIDENVENALGERLKTMTDAIDTIYKAHPKLIGAHYRNIQNYRRTARARYTKAVNMANNCANEEAFRKLLTDINNSAEATTTVRVDMLNDKGELESRDLEMDTHKAYLTVLAKARKAGFCKGAEWNKTARMHTEPQARAGRIQAAINNFFVEKQDGATSGSPAGRIILDVNKDGSVGFAQTMKENSGVFFDDADVGFVYDSDITVPYSVVAAVVKELDDFCVNSLVTPKDDEMVAKLREAFNDAMQKNDAQSFSFNFIEGLRGRTAAKFDPVLHSKYYGDAIADVEFRRERNLPIDPELSELAKNGIMSPSFQEIKASILPSAAQMKRNITENIGDASADDFMASMEDE